MRQEPEPAPDTGGIGYSFGMSELLDAARFEIAAVIQSGLQGQALADAIVARLCWRLGGQTLYWPRTDNQRRASAIRADAAAGLAPNEIAKRHGVTRRTVESARAKSNR